MKHYTPKQVNEIKQQIRTGKPLPIIADDLSEVWERPWKGVYGKVLALSRNTRKINNTWTGLAKKERAKKPRPAIVSQMPFIWEMTDNEEVVVKQVCEDIVEKEFVTMDEFKEIWDGPKEPAEICIEVPTGNISFNGIPSRVVIYSDHIRYYF